MLLGNAFDTSGWVMIAIARRLIEKGIARRIQSSFLMISRSVGSFDHGLGGTLHAHWVVGV